MRLRAALLVVFLPLLGQRAAAEPDPLATLRAGHPRLLLTNEQLATNVAAAKTDPLRAALHAYIVAEAEQSMKDQPIAHVLIGPRMLDQSRKAISHILNSAMAFRLTGDRRYAEFAKQTMLRAAAFPDWNPSHFLDVAEMATAVAIGYDWLYATLTPAERTTLKRALLDKALAFATPAYARSDPKRESFPFVGNNLTNNWNQVCNGGFLLAALALAEDEPELTRRVIAGVRETLPFATAAYAPDGAYPEGPTYWAYGTRYTVYLLAALETALGNTFGLERAPAFDRTVLFRVHAISPAGISFNYADGRSSERFGADETITWLAERFHHPFASAASRRWLANLLKEERNPETFRFVALHAVWFPSEQSAGASPPLDARFGGGAQTAVFRSAWNDPRALWVGFKTGSNAVNHAHLDLGSFVVESDGERWAMDLGRDDYDLPGYWDGATTASPRWQYYRLNNRSHNTLTLDDALQPPSANAPLTAYGSTPDRAFAIADLTAAYPGSAVSIRRGVALIDRSRVLVQDEIKSLKPGTAITWRMMTAATIASDTDRVAILTRNSRTLRAEILSPVNARFQTHPATPPRSIENQNAGINALEAVLPKITTAADVRIVVLLTPLGEKWRPLPLPLIGDLNDWK